MKIKLSDYIAKRLKEHGVNRFFMVSGGGAMHLNDSLGHAIPYTAFHHEQGCAIAAEGYARVNQDLAVVNVTTGPGGLNCLNGVFGEWTDSVPVLYISGQVKTSTKMSSYPDLPLRQLGDQEVDIISVVKPLTKYAVSITNPNEIKYHIDRAIFEATTGRKGPVWIDVPIDVQSAMIDEGELKEFDSYPSPLTPLPQGARGTFTNIVVQKLQEAQRPLIVAGQGIRLSNQIENLKKLLEMTKIPFVTTFNGFDMVETSNPYYIGRIGTIGQRAGNFALQNADLILFLGTRNNIRQVSYNWENFGKNAYKIAVDIDETELNKPLVKYDYKVCCDLKEFIPDLLDKMHLTPTLSSTGEGELVNSFQTSSSVGLDPRTEFSKGIDITPNLSSKREGETNWLEFCQNLREKYSFENHPETIQKNKIEPYHFTYALTKNLKEKDIVVMANGSACVCTFQNAVIKNGQRYIANSGNASMGYGLPASIGAYYSSGGRNVICIEGDGSIMMNLQELQTVVYNKIPLKIFVINNNGYSSIRQSQKNFFNGRMTGSGVDSGISVPDFIKIGNAFGLKTKRIDNPKTMENDILEVLSLNEPILCEVMVEEEYSFVPKLSSKKLEDGTILSPSLEDMYPFLDREEFNQNMLFSIH